jgi:hypothetical protein
LNAYFAACRLVQISPEAEAALDAADVKIIYAMAHAPEKTLSILVRAENGIWQTSVGGFGDKTPPMKDHEVLEWAKKVCAKREEGCTVS